MLNHALALAAGRGSGLVSGYRETPVDDAVLNDPRIRLYRVRSLRRASEGAPRFWFLWSRRSAQPACLRITLGAAGQNAAGRRCIGAEPTQLPTLLAAWIAARLRGSLFIVDWHNFGYTMLAPRWAGTFRGSIGEELGTLAGEKGRCSFCVSMAMRQILVRRFRSAGAHRAI